MDLETPKKLLDSLVNFLTQPAFLYPYLFLFGFLSRTCWDYLQNNKIPERKKLLALFIISGFAVVVLVIALRAYGMDESKIRLGVPVIAWIGPNLFTYLMENLNDILDAAKERIKKMISK